MTARAPPPPPPSTPDRRLLPQALDSKSNNAGEPSESRATLFVQVAQIDTPTCLSFQTNGHGPAAVYQERLSRLESDNECLVLQVSERHSSLELRRSTIIALDSAVKSYLFFLRCCPLRNDHVLSATCCLVRLSFTRDLPESSVENDPYYQRVTFFL